MVSNLREKVCLIRVEYIGERTREYSIKVWNLVVDL